ncbi:MAG: hypothetical protein QOJ29_3007 [Thermoleophilaceae bacterium]|jgi:hypothetical protein|nr:hypothetical protein [Thermoleophilaceae bacterium]
MTVALAPEQVDPDRPRTSPGDREQAESQRSRDPVSLLRSTISRGFDPVRVLEFVNDVRAVRGLAPIRSLPWSGSVSADPRTCLMARALDADVVPVIGGGGWMQFDRPDEARVVAAALRARRTGSNVSLPTDINDIALAFDLGWVSACDLKPPPDFAQTPLFADRTVAVAAP